MKNLNINSIEHKGTKLLPEQLDKVIGGVDNDFVSFYNDGRGNVGAEFKLNDRTKIYGSTNVVGAISGNPRHEVGVKINLAPEPESNRSWCTIL